jgi:uncharacterized membrane protein YphA (DoxX/SURF4 family)
MHEALALFTLRVFLGILLVNQGRDKISSLRYDDLVNTVRAGFQNKGVDLSAALVRSMIYLNSIVELAVGFLLIIGLFKTIALYALAIDLLIVTIGFSLLKAMWDLKHMFPRLAILMLLLLLPEEWDIWTLDRYLQ